MEPDCLVCGAHNARIFRRFRSDTFGAMREFEHRECRACTYIFVHPQPTPADLQRLYSSPRYYELTETEALLTDGSRERPDWKIHLYDSILTRMHRAGCREGKLLDVGCGWGLFLERATRFGFNSAGIELSAEVASYVRDRLHIEVSGVELEKAPEKSYDALTMMDVLEHVPDPRKFLGQALKALRPGGWIAVNVPRAGGLTNDRIPRLLNRIRRRKENIFLQHLSEFRPKSLHNILARAGFTGISVQGLENWRIRAHNSFPLNAFWLALSGTAVLTRTTSSILGIARRPL